jgi:hypothetical protein
MADESLITEQWMNPTTAPVPASKMTTDYKPLTTSSNNVGASPAYAPDTVVEEYSFIYATGFPAVAPAPAPAISMGDESSLTPFGFPASSPASTPEASKGDDSLITTLGTPAPSPMTAVGAPVADESSLVYIASSGAPASTPESAMAAAPTFVPAPVPTGNTDLRRCRSISLAHITPRFLKLLKLMCLLGC